MTSPAKRNEAWVLLLSSFERKGSKSHAVRLVRASAETDTDELSTSAIHAGLASQMENADSIPTEKNPRQDHFTQQEDGGLQRGYM